jgi:intracellular multiplication protein IcmT
MASVKATAHWRDSARTPRLLTIDYRAIFPLLIWLFFPNWITFIICVIAIGFFTVLDHFGYTLPVFSRYFRYNFLAGSRKIARPWWV